MIPERCIQKAFEGRTAWVTGAASGIGRALVGTLVSAGARVYALDVNQAGLASLATEWGGKGCLEIRQLDVCDPAGFGRLVAETTGRGEMIDFLFNNAGVTLLGEAQEIPFERWKWLLDINLMGVVHGIQAVYPVMIRQRSGRIINTASIAGATGYATSAAYTASKAAVLELSRSLRAEARGYGVGVSVACPGYVDSGIFSQDRIYGAEREEVMRDLPVGLMRPEDAAVMLLMGVAKGRNTIVFPWSARIFWFLAHWAPALMTPFQDRLLRVFRKSAP